MSMLLLVRNAHDMRRAVESANAFSAYMRQRLGEQVSQVIGVWLRPELDAGLPSVSCADLVSDGVGSVEGADRISESNPTSSATELKIRASFSLFGVWRFAGLTALSVTMREILQSNAAPLSTPSSVRTRERTAGFSPYSNKGNRWRISKTLCASFESNILNSSPPPGS